MPATGQDITHWCGDSRTITIPVKDAAGGNVDLAGASARWWMGKSKTASGASVYVKKTTADSSIEITNASGLYSLVVYLDPDDTKTLSPGSCYHEAEVTDASGNVSTVCIGAFVLVRDMVRP